MVLTQKQEQVLCCSVPVDWSVGWSVLNLGWVGIEAALTISIINVLCVHGSTA